MKQKEIYPYFSSFSEWALPFFDLIQMDFLQQNIKFNRDISVKVVYFRVKSI